MYENWQIERWETPVSDAGSLAMVSLIDDGKLSITVQDLRDPEARRLCFVFSKYPAYRNILEEYRTQLWAMLSNTRNLGWTKIVANSTWVAELREAEPLLDVNYPRLTHYMISTEDDVIEVLTPEPPELKWVEPGTGSDAVGKSLVLRHPDDRPQIEAIFEDVRRRQSGLC